MLLVVMTTGCFRTTNIFGDAFSKGLDLPGKYQQQFCLSPSVEYRSWSGGESMKQTRRRLPKFHDKG